MPLKFKEHIFLLVNALYTHSYYSPGQPSTHWNCSFTSATAPNI